MNSRSVTIFSPANIFGRASSGLGLGAIVQFKAPFRSPASGDPASVHMVAAMGLDFLGRDA